LELKNFVNEDFIQYQTSDPGYIVNENGETEKTSDEKQKGITFTASYKDAGRNIK
jgi:hypothetical protein